MLALFRRGSDVFDAAAYQRDGVQLLKRFLSDQDKTQLKQIYQRCHELFASGKITRTSVHSAGDHDGVFDPIDRFPPIRALAEAIVGKDYCRLVSRFLIKDASYSGAICAHQDYPYFGGCPDKLSVFIPLTEANLANGTLTFLKGSHRFGPLERGEIDIARYPDLERVTLDMDVGDIAISDFLTWHYSTPSTSAGERVLIQIVYQPSSDPSSKLLIAGNILNPVACPTRETPLKTRETQICYREAANLFHHRQYEDAQQVALGVLATDPRNVQILLLLKRISAARGDVEGARDYAARALAEAREALAECEAGN